MAGDIFDPGAGSIFNPGPTSSASRGPKRDPYPLQRHQQPSIDVGGVRYSWNPQSGKYENARGQALGEVHLGPPPVPRPRQPQQPAAPNYLGFPDGVGRTYFEDNPDQAFQIYVNKLGGANSPLGRYAARRFGEVYAAYLREAMGNPNLQFVDWLNGYAEGGQVAREYQGSSPFNRDPYNQPQWASTRYLG